MNKSIYFNAEWMEALKCMVPEIREKVITAIINYQITGEIPQMTNGKTVFMLLKLEVDHRNRRLAKAREKRAQKKAQEAPEQPAAQPEEPKETSQEAPKPLTQAQSEKPSSPRNEISPEKKAMGESPVQPPVRGTIRGCEDNSPHLDAGNLHR